MRRRLLIVILIVSSLLFVATTVLWVRSYFNMTELHWSTKQWPSANHVDYAGVNVWACTGTLTLLAGSYHESITNTDPGIPQPVLDMYPNAHPFYLGQMQTLPNAYDMSGIYRPQINQHGFFLDAQRGTTYQRQFNMPFLDSAWPSDALITISGACTRVEMILPLWSLGLVATVPPALLLLVIPIKRLLRRPKGGCHACGYNLTGNTSGVCPECGTPAPQPKRGHACQNP